MKKKNISRGIISKLNWIRLICKYLYNKRNSRSVSKLSCFVALVSVSNEPAFISLRSNDLGTIQYNQASYAYITIEVASGRDSKTGWNAGQSV